MVKLSLALDSEIMILGFDPGKDKCGVAVVGADKTVFYHEVIISQQAIATLKSLIDKYQISLLVMGNQTTAKSWKLKLEEQLSPMAIILVDEHNSTLEARDRYWEMYPARGIQKLIPQGMRLPPRPVDDLVAILLVERYLKTQPRT